MENTVTKNDALVKYVMERYSYSRNNLADRHGQWREYYQDYRGTKIANREPWQANYIVPALKDALRIKIPLYMNILFAGGIESWDIEPGEPEDESLIPILKDVIVWQLGMAAKSQGGFLAAAEAFIKQFELYGYSVCKIPWRESSKHVYEGPDLEVVDVFNFFPDPGVLDVSSSWVISRKRDVFVSYLRQLEKKGIYHSIAALKDTHQPVDGTNTQPLVKDRIELLEFHGEVPKDLLTGRISDVYEDEYVQAIITIANQKVAIRNDESPYKAGNIFLDASKDRMPNERYGVGMGEDVQALCEELTNCHNKATDCANLVANPQVIINHQKVVGASGGVILSYPGKVWMAQPNAGSVSDAIMWMNTTAQASALSPLMHWINELEQKIQKITQAVPVISPMPTTQGMPATLGATLMMQGNAAEPVKHVVRYCLEPWFQQVLDTFYKHNLQFFKKATAYRILGEENARKWIDKTNRKDLRRSDLSFIGQPDFKMRGVSIFLEKQAELQSLINFLQLAMAATAPAHDPMGNIAMGPQGTPIQEPLIDIREIVKRIAVKMGFDDIERLIPSLKNERLVREAIREQQQAPAIQAPPIPQEQAIPSFEEIMGGMA